MNHDLPTHFLTTILSGGQDGADIAALRAAKRAGLYTGGVAPRNFWTMHGTDRTLHDVYGLVEIKNVGRGTGLVQRSCANVDRADATLAVRLHASVGTDSTIGYAETKRWTPTRRLVELSGDPPAVDLSFGSHKPTLVLRRMPVDAELSAVSRAFCDFIQKHRVRTLNVCGNRDVNEAAAEALLLALFTACGQNEENGQK